MKQEPTKEGKTLSRNPGPSGPGGSQLKDRFPGTVGAVWFSTSPVSCRCDYCSGPAVFEVFYEAEVELGSPLPGSVRETEIGPSPSHVEKFGVWEYGCEGCLSSRVESLERTGVQDLELSVWTGEG